MNDEAIQNIPVEKKSFFKNIFHVFLNLKNIFKSPKYTEFTDTVDYLNKSSAVDAAFDDVKTASLLCDSAMNIAAQRIELVESHKELLIFEQNLNKFEALNDEEADDIIKLVTKVETVIKEKSTIKNQLNSVDRSLDYLARYEKQFPKILKDIKEAENMQRLLKIDIGLLEGERENLQYDKTTLESGLGFIYKFSIILICFFAFLGAFLVFLNIFYHMDIFMIASIEVLLAIFLGASIFILNRRMKYDLQKNVFFQIKVVHLLNKKKIHYVRHTNYLNYEFKKFHVRSADNLKNNWDEYCYYKHLSGRFKTVNNIIFDLEDDIQRFLAKKDITDSKYTTSNIVKMLDKNNIKKLKKEMAIDKKHLEDKLDALDNEQKEIWEQLSYLRDNDKTYDKIIDTMISDYFSEMEA